MKAKVTVDSRTAGHVMPEGTFLHVELERKTSPTILVAENGEQLGDLSEKTVPFLTNEGFL